MASTAATPSLITLEFHLSAPKHAVPLLEELLWTLPHVESIQLAFPEPHLPMPLDATQPVKVYTSGHDLSSEIQQLLTSTDVLKTCHYVGMRSLKHEDWAETWKQHWDVQSITPRLTICPSWKTYTPKQADEIVLHLDPGMAFGTGTHETTRLMLRALDTLSQTLDPSTQRVLDIGTGSGILAIAAGQLGWPHMMGIDISKDIIQVAQENAERNPGKATFTWSTAPLSDTPLKSYDLILANILGPIIESLLPDMVTRLTHNGVLLASGLNEAAKDHLLPLLEAHGFQSIRCDQEGPWFLLEGHYRAEAA